MANWQGIGKTSNRAPAKYNAGRAFRNSVKGSLVRVKSSVRKSVSASVGKAYNKSLLIRKPIGYVGGVKPIVVKPRVPISARMARVGNRLTVTVNNAANRVAGLVEGSMIRVGNVLGQVVGVSVKTISKVSYSIIKFVVKFVYAVGRAFGEVTTPKVRVKTNKRDTRVKLTRADGSSYWVDAPTKGTTKPRYRAEAFRKTRVNATAATFTAGVLTTSAGAVLEYAGAPVKKTLDSAAEKLREVLGI